VIFVAGDVRWLSSSSTRSARTTTTLRWTGSSTGTIRSPCWSPMICSVRFRRWRRTFSSVNLRRTVCRTQSLPHARCLSLTSAQPLISGLSTPPPSSVSTALFVHIPRDRITFSWFTYCILIVVWRHEDRMAKHLISLWWHFKKIEQNVIDDSFSSVFNVVLQFVNK